MLVLGKTERPHIKTINPRYVPPMEHIEEQPQTGIFV